MSLKYKITSVFASAVLLGSFAIAASAQDQAPAVRDNTEKAEKHGRKGFGHRGGFGRGMRGGKFGGMRGLAGIELTEVQKAQIKQVHEANRPDAATMEEFRSLHEARRAGTLTEDQKARAKALHDQMRAKRESVRQQILAILTPEQRQQIETRREEMRKKKEEMRQLRQNRKPGQPAENSDPVNN